MRLVPFSYFCTCWNVKAKSVAKFLLAHAKHHPAHSHSTADVLVDWVGTNTPSQPCTARERELPDSVHEGPLDVWPLQGPV